MAQLSVFLFVLTKMCRAHSHREAGDAVWCRKHSGNSSSDFLTNDGQQQDLMFGERAAMREVQ